MQVNSKQVQQFNIMDWMQIVQYMEAIIEDNTFSFTDIVQFGEFQMDDRAGKQYSNMNNTISNSKWTGASVHHLSHNSKN